VTVCHPIAIFPFHGKKTAAAPFIKHMQRREVLKLTGCGAAGAAFAPWGALRGEPGRGQPNVLFIMSDEHNATVLGANGNRIIWTPNLDGLAARGVSFDACYCNSPLCVPSRESFLSGST
jgi:choline-sulfatase